MPKKATEKNATWVRNMNTPGLHAVGGVSGLLLQVTKTGAKSWILRKRIAGRRRDIGLGGFPDVLLAGARERARDLADDIRKGIDPVEAKKAADDKLLAERLSRMTFAEAAAEYHKEKAKEFRNHKHRRDWINSLERHALPVIGDLPVSAIEMPHVRKVLSPIWESHTETATRVRQRLESVLSWATVSGYRTGENPARWKDNLEHALANPSRVRKKSNFAALPWQQVGAFLTDLQAREGIGARALEFLILTAARSGEVRGATWGEIDLEARLWTIPGERMKAGKTHRVPLSDAAVRLLTDLPRTGELVFPAPRGGSMSDMTITATIRRMHKASVEAGGVGYTDPHQGDKVVTAHGFRSSFKDWARSKAKHYADEVSELALAHINSDATRAAYARDELIDQRRDLMTEWATFCTATEAVE